MKAVSIREPGGADVLEIVDYPVPIIRTDEVLIKVAASGVNRPDILQRKGVYQIPPDASPIPGLEVSGEIVETGKDVSKTMLGKKVVALTHGGGYAEYCAANIGHCLDWPKSMNATEAASLPETSFTVFHNLLERGNLVVGETVLIHGGSSGIGVMAIQIAKAVGATVIVTAGSEEKCRFCIELGADQAIDYTQKEFDKEVMKFTGNGVDVVLDMVGGAYVGHNVRVLTIDGRYVSIAYLLGHKVELNLAAFILKRLTLTGSTLRPQSVQQKARIASGVRDKIWPLILQGEIKSCVDSVFDLAEAPQAHDLMESSKHKGKIVLTVG